MRERKGRIVSILLIFTLALGILQPIGVIQVRAADMVETNPDMFVWDTDTRPGEAILKNITDEGKRLTDLVIPSSYNGLPVTEIGDYSIGSVLEDNRYINNIVIPEGVVRLGNGSFHSLKNLDKVTIPESVKEIGDSAFDSCGYFKINKLPNNLVSVGNWAFYGTSVDIERLPNTLERIGKNAFAGTSLKQANLTENLKELGQNAFYKCHSLTGTVHIPGSIKRVPSSLLYDTKVTKVVLSEGVEEIDEYAFTFSSIAEISMPSTLKKIGMSAFSNCSKLEQIELPNSVTEFGNSNNASYGGDRIFSGCSALKIIKLSDNITRIPNDSFNGCISLESLELPNGITTIGERAFAGCKKLTKMVIPENVIELGTLAFSNCSSMETIKLPKGITKIKQESFENCSSLRSIEMNFDEITGIEASAFSGCTNLQQDFTFKDLLDGIGASAFSNSGVKSIAVDSIASLGPSSFSSCLQLKKVQLPDLVTVGANSFMGCINLTDINLSSVQTIQNNAFKNCSNLVTFNFPKLKEIGANAFEACDSLTDICIPNAVTTIGADAFKTSGITVVTNLYTDNTVAIGYDWMTSHRNTNQHSVIDYNRIPTASPASRTYRKANPSDIHFAVDLGRGSKAATDIAGVMINYIELDESSYELSGNTLIIKKEVLTDLDKGFYDVGVTFNDTDGTSITGLLSILVVESSSSDNNNGDNSKPPVALETLSYQFYKDYQRDIVVPIQMNSANTLEELYLGTDLIDKDKYSFANDTIILDKNYLDTVSAGLYRLIPVFDGDKKINNLLLEIYDKYDDRLLPYLLPSHISFKNQDLRLKVELGEGKTKANDIKLLVIDDMYITPNGEIHQKNPLTYGRTASGAAIIKSRIQTYLSLGKNLIKVEAKSPKAYYLDGDELVLTANLIKKLGFVADSVHTVGCIFDNSEETASLNRVTLVIPNQQNDSDNSGDQNNGNNSNGDSNNSNNQNNGNNNNQGNNSNGDSNSSGNQNNGNNNNQGNNSNGDSNSSSNQNNGNNNNQGSNSNGSSSNSGNQTSGGGTNQGTNANESNNSSQQHENGVLIAETITLKDIIYTGKSDVIIPLTKVNETVAHIKLNGRELKKEEYQIVGNQLVLFRSTLNQLKDGTNGITIQTKSDIPRTYIAFIQFDFSKQESKIPFMTTYKLLLKGSKFPVYLSNQKEAKKITWNTSNSKIVSVSKKGVLTARKKGKATVTCVITNKKGDLYKFQIKVTVKDGKKKSFYTRVKKKPYDSNFPVFIMDKLVYKGKTVHIKVSNLSKDSKISYKSSNPSVATVDKKGNIKGSKKGKATITVTLKQNKETYIYQLQCQCK